MATGPADVPQHEVLRSLAAADRGLREVHEAALWSMAGSEVRQALEQASALLSVARSAYLRLLAESATRDAAAVGPDGAVTHRDGAETSTWLAHRRRLTPGRVQADLREARALDPDTGDLPGLGRHLATGDVTAEHASIAVRALTRIPATIRRTRAGEIDRTLTGHATTFAPPAARILAEHLLAVVEPDRTRHTDTRADQRRELYVATDSTGMLVVRGQLEPAGGATVKALLDHLSAPHRGPVQALGAPDAAGGQAGKGGEGGGPEQTQLRINDLRTPAQRRHDALVQMAHLAAGNLDAGVRAGQPPRVVVHTTTAQLAEVTGASGTSFTPDPSTTPDPASTDDPAQPRAGSATCEQTGPICPTTLGRLACDAVIDRILLDAHGRVLQMDTLGRLFTPSQRRALAARDGGCAFPGCDRPPSWCDAHHILYWAHGGPTTLQNGVLLCGTHHTTVHLGEWTLTVSHGVPWFLPPARLDPARTPVRNNLHTAVADTRRTGQQLSLPTHDPPDG